MSRWPAVAAWLAFLALCIATLIPARMTADLGAFLPTEPDAEQKVAAEQLHRGAASRLLLVSIARADGEPTSEAEVEHLVERLEQSGLFRLVTHRPDPALLPERDQLMGHRYLLSDGWDPRDFQAEQLRLRFETLVRELRRGGAIVDEQLLARDPTGELSHLLEQWLGGGGRETDGSGWRAREGRALLVAQADAPSDDLDRQAQAIERIQSEASASTPRLHADITGPPAIAVATRETIRAEATRLTILASAAALAILLLTLQSARAIAIAALPITSAVLAGAAAVHMVFGSIHGITLAFGATLLGVTLDYPLHHLWRARHLPGTEAARAIRRPLLVGALSTALGFTALALADARGLQQLALFSIAGLATAAATTSWVLPALTQRSWQPLLNLPQIKLPRIPRRITTGLAWVLLAAGIIAALTTMRFETDLSALSPVPEELKQQDNALRAELGLSDPRHLVAVHSQERETALQASETVASHLAEQIEQGRLERYDAITRVLPSAATQTRRAEALPEKKELQEAITKATADLPLRAEGLTPFVEDVAKSRQLDPLALEDLPPGPLRDWLEAHLHHHGDGSWSALLYLGGVDSPAELADSLPAGRLIDLQQQANELATTYQHQAALHLGLGTALIALVLLLGTLSVRHGLQVLWIAGAAVGGTVGLLTGLGVTFSIFHTIALLLVIGLSIDYGLFAHAGDQHERSLASVTVCAASSVAAFVILATAEIPLLQAIGMTVACGAALAWLLTTLYACDDPQDRELRITPWHSST